MTDLQTTPLPPRIARLTVDGMRSVLARIEELRRLNLPDDEFRARGKAIFAEQRERDAPTLSAG